MQAPIVYQNYYLEDQKSYLDPAFVPYNNTKNEHPELREYPILKKLHEKNKDNNVMWGLVSWRWKEKTCIDGIKFINWIQNTPGADVYHINHDLDHAAKEKNIFLHGEQHHKGMLKYFERLNYLMNWKLNFHNTYPPKYFITCHFYVMNSRHWAKWLKFLDKCLEVSYNDQSLNYFLRVETSPRYGKAIPNFSFVVERLIALYCLLNKDLVVNEYFESNRWVPVALRR